MASCGSEFDCLRKIARQIESTALELRQLSEELKVSRQARGSELNISEIILLFMTFIIMISSVVLVMKNVRVRTLTRDIIWILKRPFVRRNHYEYEDLEDIPLFNRNDYHLRLV